VLYRTLGATFDIYLPIMAAKRIAYKTTTIARAKAASSQFRAAKKKASKVVSRKAKSVKTQS
jgi:hypothetical protein